MNSLINRAIEEFLRATHSEALVREVAEEATAGRPAAPGASFGTPVLERAAARLSKPLPEMVEDMGGWMTRVEPIRRLLRFSGRDFRDFLLRLDELPGRTHLVLHELVVPRLQVEADERSVWLVMLQHDPVWQHLLVGLIRGMADDYGALCLISVEERSIRVDIWDEQFAEGRCFSLQSAQLPGPVPT